MSPIVPSLPPHRVQLGFDYVLAVEAGKTTLRRRGSRPRWSSCRG
ncbi:hypothetical protein [Streptomyces achromogenes]